MIQSLLLRTGRTFKRLINVKNALFNRRQIYKRTDDVPTITKERGVFLREVSALKRCPHNLERCLPKFKARLC